MKIKKIKKKNTSKVVSKSIQILFCLKKKDQNKHKNSCNNKTS